MGLSVGPNTRHGCEGLEETASQESGKRIKAAQSNHSAMKARTLALPTARITIGSLRLRADMIPRIFSA
jgi:hypothetical protein